MLREALRKSLAGETLSREEARTVFGSALSEDTDPVLFGGFLAALAQRGETALEITGAAEALRSAARVFEHDQSNAIDTCGTGGDGSGSFNVSTGAAIVACAAGAQVVKHGNRSVSSKCGSADLLEAAGLPLELSPEEAREVLDLEGITFLFAPLYHPAMRFAAPVRRSLGIRTMFNLLGPLCHPGGVRRQLLGVGDAERVPVFAEVLQALGHERALIVHGAGGADELTLAGTNVVSGAGDAGVHGFDAHDLDLTEAPVSALAGGGPETNLRLLHAVLRGERSAILDAVLLNTAAALHVAGLAEDAASGLARAREAVASGAALGKFESWMASAQRVVARRAS